EPITKPVPQAVAETPKPVEKKPAKGKPIVENRKSEPATPQTSTRESAKGSQPDTNAKGVKPAPAAVKPQADSNEKSGWNSFKESVKQGTKAECSQGERALNQCK